MNDTLIQSIKILILKGFSNAQHAHDEIFKKERLPIITSHLSIANSFIYSARAVYICNESLSRLEFDDFFHQFDTFSSEVMTNLRTDHSHQWSDIEFNSLEETYKKVAPLLGIIL